MCGQGALSLDLTVHPVSLAFPNNLPNILQRSRLGMQLAHVHGAPLTAPTRRLLFSRDRTASDLVRHTCVRVVYDFSYRSGTNGFTLPDKAKVNY
jgi:hypothetical protein